VVRDASFDVGAGEILGVAAVEGSGQHELLRAIAGRLRPESGSLDIPRWIGFVPEDRHRDALVLEYSLTENIALRGAGRARGMVRWDELRRRTADVVSSFDVRARGVATRAGALSGGNQQKLVLGRELADRPELLVAENPTRGLDIRAATAVEERLVAARDAGTAVVLYSSDLDDVLRLADRVLVLHGGTVRELPPDRQQVGAAMLGA
jgi:simple sugar transport system ATP-binding protein